MEIGKTYEISVILLADVNDYIKFYLAKEDKSKKYYPMGTLYGHQTTRMRGASGNLHMLFTPTASDGTKFGILLGSDSSSSDPSTKFIYEECGLTIKEI